MLIDVSIRSNTIRLCSTQSHSAKYLILVLQVCVVAFCAFPIAVHPLLSL